MDERLSEPLVRILDESTKLGARSFTASADGSRTLRIHLEPEKEPISDLRVFLSHTTKDQKWADHVKELLEGVGFKVSYLRASIPPEKLLTDSEISQTLVDTIDDADYLCMLFSRMSAARPWVRHEFKIAARLMGRIVLLKDDSVETIADFAIPRFERRALLTVKYQILAYDSGDSEMALKLARTLLNDPDEGVSDGRYRPLVIRERHLKRENHFRRFIRAHLDELPEYTSRHVVDVLPFKWREIGGRTDDIDEIVEWFVSKHGRLGLRVDLNLGRVEVTLLEIPSHLDLAGWTQEPTINALVVWKREWDPAIERLRNRAWI